MVALGMFTLWSQADAASTLVALAGVLLLCGGAVALPIGSRGRSSLRIGTAAGVASITLGVVALAWPNATLLVLALLAGVGLVAVGACGAYASLTGAAVGHRPVALVSGVALAALGVLVALHPALSAWTLGVLVALGLVWLGAYSAAAGFRLLDAARGPRVALARRRSAPGPGVRLSGEDRLRRHWGVAQCSSCGGTLVLGEPSRQAIDTVVCQTCLEAAPARPSWTAAPVRLRPTPVPLSDERNQPRSAPEPAEPSRAAEQSQPSRATEQGEPSRAA